MCRSTGQFTGYCTHKAPTKCKILSNLMYEICTTIWWKKSRLVVALHIYFKCKCFPKYGHFLVSTTSPTNIMVLATGRFTSQLLGQCFTITKYSDYRHIWTQQQQILNSTSLDKYQHFIEIAPKQKYQTTSNKHC